MEVSKKEMRYAKSFKEQLTFRGLVIGALGAIIITTSSMYVALRMGALPWPTIFVAVMSMTVLKALGKTNLNEINVTHTAMSAGSMVAGGLAFTIPGIWMLNENAEVGFLTLLIITLSGTILGVIFTALVRKYFIEGEKLPFPMGIAASETVLAGDEGGAKAKTLFSTLGVTAVFTALRDGLGLIPGAWMSATLMAKNIFFGIWISPMAAAIGYIIGPLFTGVWFLGAALVYFFIIPVGVSAGWFSDVAAATAFKDSLGIGLMVGTGIGVLLKGIIPKTKEIYGPMLRNKTAKEGGISLKWAPFVFALVALFLTILTDMRLLPSIITILGVWLTTAMAASITGQTGINPMEIFGIIVLLSVKALFGTVGVEGFLIAAVVAVACGLTGDVLNDFKSGFILKTNPKAQLISETVGGIIGAVVSVIVLFVMFRAYGAMGPGTDLPAPQAYAVSTMVGGLPNTSAFIIGLVLGAALYLLNIPGMTLGLGIYLPMMISSTVFMGGLLNYIVSKVKPEKSGKGVIVSSGMLGGEGVTGVVIAIIKVITMG
ncbi:putative oligopeptide transporter, OPT family [Natronincola peptidivorans]|uniref:Putative oligopeptide transporter, OPT family n=1 Tax=Natronincola peptidivorans TaxID=426128 RepID=A0A1I0AKR5_9FIRM|nr:OPT/YSL family transporter [Natronincola peptidivorans]SES94298.1 putative oligopeptide transporter, OPT family [Natronincola peptidivorans]